MRIREAATVTKTVAVATSSLVDYGSKVLMRLIAYAPGT